MAKMIILGNAVVVTSTRTLEEFKELQKYMPESLVLSDEEGNPIFKVGVSEVGNFNKYGVSFDSEARDMSGKATVTLDLPYDVDNAVAYVRDTYGSALLNLNKIEEGMTDAFEALEKVKEEVAESIVVVRV